MRRFTVAHLAVLMSAAGVAVAAQTGAPRVTVEWLKSLKVTTNDASGDGFVGSRDQLNRIVDAIVADSSLVSPMYLFIAAKTALAIDRVEDAGFLFYAGQLRAAFDAERLNVAKAPDGSNAATYLGFLRQTVGASVNPAIMGVPKEFAAVMDRLDRWEIVPSRQAYYPEYAAGTASRIPPDQWPSAGSRLKAEFMTMFGRRQARLLNDPEYFEAFRFVQSMNFGKVPNTPENRARFNTSLLAMRSAEERLFPGTSPTTPAPPASSVTKPSPPPSSAATDPNKPRVVRAGTEVPIPKLIQRVEPVFPAGSTGSVILEVIVGVDGKVEDVRILRNIPALDAAAATAVRQWVYAPTLLDGQPVRVVLTTTVSAGK